MPAASLPGFQFLVDRLRVPQRKGDQTRDHEPETNKPETVSELERSPDRKADRALLFEQEEIVSLGVRVPGEYQPEGHVDNRNLNAKLPAHAVAIALEESASRFLKSNGCDILPVPEYPPEPEAGRQSARDSGVRACRNCRSVAMCPR